MRRHLLVFALCILPFFPAQSATYYVDAKNGNDGNSGTSPTSAWKSLEKVSGFQFQPGDSVLFKRGEIWREQLNFPSSGAEGRPIVLDAYGAGALPIISGADLVQPSAWNSSPTPSIWQANVATEPNVVIFDGAKGRKQTALENVKQPMDWFWSAGTLYAAAPANPGQAFAKSGVEAGTRMSAVNLSGKNYVTVRNLEVSGANAAPYALGSNIWAIAATRKGPPPGNLEISHCVVVNSAGDGIHLEGASGSKVDANLVANNEARMGALRFTGKPWRRVLRNRPPDPDGGASGRARPASVRDPGARNPRILRDLGPRQSVRASVRSTFASCGVNALPDWARTSWSKASSRARLTSRWPCRSASSARSSFTSSENVMPRLSL